MSFTYQADVESRVSVLMIFTVVSTVSREPWWTETSVACYAQCTSHETWKMRYLAILQTFIHLTICAEANKAFLEIILYEINQDDGRYLIRKREINGIFSNFGTANRAEGDIIQVSYIVHIPKLGFDGHPCSVGYSLWYKSWRREARGVRGQNPYEMPILSPTFSQL